MTAALAEAGGVLFSATAATYAGSLGGYVFSLATTKQLLSRAATVLRLAGLAFHTIFLLTRYVNAGLVEVAAREAAGVQLSAYERAWVFIGHPPYTNLYESLMFITWSVMAAYTVVEWKWKLRPLGVAATAITLAGLAEAYIVLEKEVRPLVPALQSWWILVHVGMLFIAYALFLLAAAAGFLYLLRAGARTATMGAAAAAATGVVSLLAGGAGSLLTRGAFEVTPLAFSEGRWGPVHWFPAGAQKAVRWWTEVPGTGPLVLAAVALLLAAAVLFWRERGQSRPPLRSPAWLTMLGGFGVLTAALGWLAWRLAATPPIVPPAGVAFAADSPGPFRLSVGGNYSLGLLALAWATAGAFLGTVPLRERIVARLPDAKKLDDMVYRLVVVAFPLVTIGIVMGGMWAYDAWGRFWGWDPKETWALITWAIYALYLHVRITYGPGKGAAALAVFGFAVVLFTYMGVNLGLTGEGLHVYGSG